MELLKQGVSVLCTTLIDVLLSDHQRVTEWIQWQPASAAACCHSHNCPCDSEKACKELQACWFQSASASLPSPTSPSTPERCESPTSALVSRLNKTTRSSSSSYARKNVKWTETVEFLEADGQKLQVPMSRVR